MAAASRLILLTGAAGFVGRQVLRALGERGCQVRPVVREGKQERFAHDDVIDTRNRRKSAGGTTCSEFWVGSCSA